MTYEEKLKNVLAKYSAIKNLDKKEIGRQLTKVIGDELDVELLASSKNILTLFQDIITFDDKLLSRLRETDWYGEWLLSNGVVVGPYLDPSNYFEYSEEERLTCLIHGKPTAEEFKYSLEDIIKENGASFLLKAVNKYCLEHGFFKHKDIDMIPLLTHAKSYMDKMIVSASALIINKENALYLDKETKESMPFQESLKKFGPLPQLEWILMDVRTRGR